jgi:hypothetical protein
MTSEERQREPIITARALGRAQGEVVEVEATNDRARRADRKGAAPA